MNSINAAGWTPLHDAVERGEAGVVAALLAAGADPDCVIPGGKWAGMSARDMGLAKVIVAGFLFYIFNNLTESMRNLPIRYLL